MIDKQAEVFTRVMNKVMDDFSYLTELNFASDTSVMPPKLPHISIVQSDSITLRSSEDNDLIENKATLTFTVTVYSNASTGKMEQCRQIMSSVDNQMLRMNFVRMSYAFVPNMNNNAIARLVAKYQVVADESNFYRIGR